MNGEIKYSEKELKRAGIKYTFEHSSGSIRVDVLAMNEDEAREVFIKTVRRPDVYSLVMRDVNGMEELK
ncbi:MAG: hypothetical protein PHP08_00885 [Candidatus Dojkabacteria bacterium]|nr:hypothetical protein [Candidatus Dojkabacteria bacterium]